MSWVQLGATKCDEEMQAARQVQGFSAGPLSGVLVRLGSRCIGQQQAGPASADSW